MQPKIAQNWPKLAFWGGQNGFPGPVQLEGGPDAPFRYVAVFMGLHRCLLILRSTFHGATQKYGEKSPGLPQWLCFNKWKKLEVP